MILVVYIYDDKEVDLLMYNNIDSFIFHSLFVNIFSNDEIERNTNIKINDVQGFLRDNERYKIEGIGGYYYTYYLNGNMLVVFDRKDGYYSIYKGGILDFLI